MRKITLYILSACSLLVYGLSLNRPFMEWWADFRTYKLNSPYARARYGDLYSNCFLPGYMDTAYIPLKEFPEEGNTDLYMIHDSYLAGRVSKNNFKGVRKLVMADLRGGDVKIHLDTSRRNVLIFECSERTAGWRFTDTATAYSRMSTRNVPSEHLASGSEPLANYFFNPFIDLNLEFSLYDYEYFKPVKEAKAWINYSLFRRLPKDVAVSTNERYLFLGETVDPVSHISSFVQVDTAELNHVTRFANEIGDHFKKIGFDEVYFSMVPNPVSILDEFRLPYNHKLERLEQHPARRVNYLSVYHLFQRTTRQIYRRDDSHWNGHGLQLWIDAVNQKLNHGL